MIYVLQNFIALISILVTLVLNLLVSYLSWSHRSSFVLKLASSRFLLFWILKIKNGWRYLDHSTHLTKIFWWNRWWLSQLLGARWDRSSWRKGWWFLLWVISSKSTQAKLDASMDNRPSWFYCWSRTAPGGVGRWV